MKESYYILQLKANNTRSTLPTLLGKCAEKLSQRIQACNKLSRDCQHFKSSNCHIHCYNRLSVVLSHQKVATCVTGYSENMNVINFRKIYGFDNNITVMFIQYYQAWWHHSTLTKILWVLNISQSSNHWCFCRCIY